MVGESCGYRENTQMLMIIYVYSSFSPPIVEQFFNIFTDLGITTRKYNKKTK